MFHPAMTLKHDFAVSGSLKEARINLKMLQCAEKIRVGNALRGWFDVNMIE